MFPQNNQSNPMKDIEVTAPPDDTISAMKFSPSTSLPKNFLLAGSWDCSVRCWEVADTGSTMPKAMKTMTGPVLDVGWHDDGTKAFIAGADKCARVWDLAADQVMQVAAHDNAVKTCHWVKAPNYCCLMTGSWDKTLKFWDLRQPNPILQFQLPERCYTADVEYPMAVVGTANRHVIIYSLENQPQEFKRHESPLKYQHRCVSIFNDMKKKSPAGYALGSIEGRVAIQYLNPVNPKDNFTFKCHRVNGTANFQDIYAVNDIAFHPIHGTLVTVGSDGTFSFWDKDARTKLKSSETLDQSITKCAFSAGGHIFAYAVGYDWSKGHEFYNPQKKSYILLRSCFEELKPRHNN